MQLVASMFAAIATKAGAAGVTGAAVQGVPAAKLAAIAAGEATHISAVEATAFAASQAASSLTSNLALGAAGVGAVFSVAQGQAEARAAREASRFERVNASIEETRGIQAANDINEELLGALSSNRAAAGAAGLDPGFGSFANLERVNRRNARLQEITALRGGRMAAGSRRFRSRQLMSSARRSQIGGFVSGGASLASGILRRMDRG